MKRWFVGLTTLMAAAAALIVPQLKQPGISHAQDATQQVSPVVNQNFGAAPELENTVWLNTDAPLRLADLRGQVVLLEMWTFDCINCIRTLPYVQRWHETYAEQGLVVIGNHYPEFNYERDLGNLTAAIERLGITYPVAQDNEGVTWRAYNQRYWPTMYLIDKQGDIRWRHIGEGRYNDTELAIQTLLAEPYTAPEVTPTAN